jgi:hypothetical protein
LTFGLPPAAGKQQCIFDRFPIRRNRWTKRNSSESRNRPPASSRTSVQSGFIALGEDLAREPGIYIYTRGQST